MGRLLVATHARFDPARRGHSFPIRAYRAVNPAFVGSRRFGIYLVHDEQVHAGAGVIGVPLVEDEFSVIYRFLVFVCHFFGDP